MTTSTDPSRTRRHAWWRSELTARVTLAGAFVAILLGVVYATGDWATVLVREHLTLSEFATGKDPYDPAVAEELADRLHHDKMLLDMLFDLTRADGSSLGATAGETITKQYGWSKWREQIVRGMYSAARAAM